MNFLFRPQYIVFKPAKMRYFQLKSTIYCGRVKLANRFERLYHMLESKGKGVATGGAAPPHLRRVAPQGTSRRVPCQVNNAQSKPLTCTAQRTAPLTAGGSYKPAQHSAHTTAQFIASAFQNRRWRTRAKLKGRYWRTLKIAHRAVRIQLHHRVTVVLPAPAV